VKFLLVLILGVIAAWPGLALAGSGWYLLAAPQVGPYDEREETYPSWLGTNAPLSSWQHLGAYDSAQACEAAKREQGRIALDVFKGVQAKADRATEYGAKWYANSRMYMIGLTYSRCVASDDPRLK